MAVNSKFEMSEERKQEILSWPIVEVPVAGVPRRGHFNQETKEFWVVDDDGNLTGEVGHARKKATPKVPTEDVLGLNDEDAYMPPEDIEDERPKKKKKKSEGKPAKEPAPAEAKTEKKKIGAKQIILGAVIIIAALAFIAYMLYPVLESSGIHLFGQNQSAPVDTQTATPTPTISVAEPDQGGEDDEGAAAVVEDANSVYLLAASRDLYPGEQITDDMLVAEPVTKAEYNQLLANGYPCLEDDKAHIIDMYVMSYTPQGEYIKDSNIGRESPIGPNPYLDYTNAYTPLTVSVDHLNYDAICMFGTMGTLDIAQTVVDSQEYTGEEEYVEGVEISENTISEEDIVVVGGDGETYAGDITTTTKVKTYRISDAVIIDILNASGESIYQYITPYMDVTGIRRDSMMEDLRNDKAFKSNTKAAYVVFLITVDQSDVIGDVSDAEVTFYPSNTFDASSSEKEDFFYRAEQFFLDYYAADDSGASPAPVYSMAPEPEETEDWG